MADRDPKSAHVRLTNLDSGWSSARTEAAPPVTPEDPSKDEIVHRVVESERSLEVKHRSSAPPPVASPEARGGSSRPPGPVARSTVRMVRPEIPGAAIAAITATPVPPPPANQARTMPLNTQMPPVSVTPVIDVGAAPVAPPQAAPAQRPAPGPMQPRNAGGMPSTTLVIPTPASIVPPGAAPAVPAPPQAAGSSRDLVHVTREERWHGPPGGAPSSMPPPARPQLPPGPNPLDTRLVLITEPESARAVAFRLLRDTLLSKELPRILAVAGTAPQDGVTTCAVNVALALAEQTQNRVLLMDGNFAAPALAKIFSMDGFGPANDALTPLKLAALMSRFHVAAIVRRNAEAPPRFDKIRYQRVLEHLAQQGYDHIVIDAGALKPGSAAAQLVTTADATLLAVRAGRTTARALRRASSQIPPGRAIGVTLVDDEPHE